MSQKMQLSAFTFKRWIREMEGSKLKTVLAVDANMMRTIETAIKVGDAVLLKVSYLYSHQI